MVATELLLCDRSTFVGAVGERRLLVLLTARRLVKLAVGPIGS